MSAPISDMYAMLSVMVGYLGWPWASHTMSMAHNVAGARFAISEYADQHSI